MMCTVELCEVSQSQPAPDTHLFLREAAEKSEKENSSAAGTLLYKTEHQASWEMTADVTHKPLTAYWVYPCLLAQFTNSEPDSSLKLTNLFPPGSIDTFSILYQLSNCLTHRYLPKSLFLSTAQFSFTLSYKVLQHWYRNSDQELEASSSKRISGKFPVILEPTGAQSLSETSPWCCTNNTQLCGR